MAGLAAHGRCTRLVQVRKCFTMANMLKKCLPACAFAGLLTVFPDVQAQEGGTLADYSLEQLADVPVTGSFTPKEMVYGIVEPFPLGPDCPTSERVKLESAEAEKTDRLKVRSVVRMLEGCIFGDVDRIEQMLLEGEIGP